MSISGEPLLLHVCRKNGGRGLIGCENSVRSEENGWSRLVCHKQYRTIASYRQNKQNYNTRGNS